MHVARSAAMDPHVDPEHGALGKFSPTGRSANASASGTCRRSGLRSTDRRPWRATQPAWSASRPAPARATGVNFCVYGRYATRVELLLFEAPDAPEPFQVVALARGEPNLPFLARVRRRPARGHLLRVADGRSAGHRADRPALRSAQGSARPVGARRERHGLGPPQGRRSRRGQARVAAGLRDGDDAACSRASSRAGSTVRSSTSYVGGFAAIPRAASSTPEPSPAIEKILTCGARRDPRRAHAGDGFRRWDVPPAAARRPAQLLGLQHPQLLGRTRIAASRRGRRTSSAPDRRAARGGIGVLLDVVFNHTAEAGASGPVINFKGLANDVVYILDPADRRRYRDFTGCGNTVSCNHPLVTTTSSTASSTGSSASASTASASTSPASSPATRRA